MGEAAACSTAALRSAISSAVRASSASSSRLRAAVCGVQGCRQACMTMLPRVPLHSFTVLSRAGELWGHALHRSEGLGQG